jgi:hypothetical protein
MNSHSLNNQIAVITDRSVVAHLNYSTGCIIAIDGGRLLA